MFTVNGSMDTYQQNAMATSLNVFAEPLPQLESDCGKKIFFPAKSRMIPPNSTSYTHQKLRSIIHHQLAIKAEQV